MQLHIQFIKDQTQVQKRKAILEVRHKQVRDLFNSMKQAKQRHELRKHECDGNNAKQGVKDSIGIICMKVFEWLGTPVICFPVVWVYSGGVG